MVNKDYSKLSLVILIVLVVFFSVVTTVMFMDYNADSVVYSQPDVSSGSGTVNLEVTQKPPIGEVILNVIQKTGGQ